MNDHLPLALIAIIGAKSDKTNFTTIGDIAIAGLNPKLVMISVHANHFITGQIRETGKFSINIPGMDMLECVKYCSEHSGHHTDKGQLPHSLYEDIPYLPQAGQVHFCEVLSETVFETRVVFVSQVTFTRKMDLKEVILYTLDHQYHRFPL